MVFISLKVYNISIDLETDSAIDEAKLIENNYQKFLLRPLKAKDINLNQSFLNRLNNFHNENNKVENFAYYYKKFTEIKSDSLLLIASFEYYVTKISGKYKSLKELNLKFPEFFIINQKDIDALNNYKNQIELLHKKIAKYKNCIYTTEEILGLLYTLSIWILICLFGLRYLIYAAKWAINVIKE